MLQGVGLSEARGSDIGGPERLQDVPEMAQNGLKTAPKRPQDGPGRP